MKLHYVLAAGAAALLLLAGCESGVTEVSETGKAVSVPVWFESIGGPSTKVDVDGETGIGTWTPGDQIAIYVQGTGANFYQIKPVENIEDAPDNNIGHVMVSLTAGQDRANYAIYPASAAVEEHVTEGDLYVNYPAEYDYSNLTVAQMETYSPTPMVAINTPVADLDDPSVESESLNFYHVGGVLRVTVPGVPQSAYSLRFTFPESFKVSGTFQVADGGTANATLTDAGLDDHSNVIDIKIPVPETSIQDLVLNIPMPSGDYSTSVRDIKIEVRTERIAYMKSDGIINFASILRAQGKKQIVPTVETLGTMAEMYLSRGYLLRTTTTTVNPSDVSFEDPLAGGIYKNSNVSQKGGRFYFSWIHLGRIMTGDSSFDGSTGFEDAEITIDGVKYRVPSKDDWDKIITGPRPGSIVNGTARVRFARVNVPLSSTSYGNDAVTGNQAWGYLLFPDGGVFETTISSFNSGTVSNITYAEYRRLTDGPNACTFIYHTGRLNGSSWETSSSWNLPYIWSSTPTGEKAYTVAGMDPFASLPKTTSAPVRLIRVED